MKGKAQLFFLLVTVGGLIIFSQRYILKLLKIISASEFGGETLFFLAFIAALLIGRGLYVFLQDSDNSSAVIKTYEIISQIPPFSVFLPRTDKNGNQSIFEHIGKELKKQEDKILKHVDERVSADNISESFKDLYKEKILGLATDDIIKIAEEKYSENSLKKDFQKSIESDIIKSSQRLESQINRTNRSASINLIVGVFTTAAAVYLLYSTLSGVGVHQIKSLQDFLVYVPRLTLSIFIEIFAFFFLRLYRKNLDDIKYLYNEWTNMELKSLAHKTALHKDNIDLIKTVVEEFSKTERNFLIKQGESTIEAERLKIEGDEKNKIIEAISSLIKKPADGK